MSILLLMAIVTYGNLVLTGVVEESRAGSSRCCWPVCRPATCWPGRQRWRVRRVVVWFVLGYACMPWIRGLGSLASRTEDASSVAGPVSYVLLAGFWASYIAVANNPASGWSQVVSLFPATAPFAMPGCIALGAVAPWEPLLAVAISLAAITGLVVFAGRLYTGAILHTGPTLKLRDAWRQDSHLAACGSRDRVTKARPTSCRCSD